MGVISALHGLVPVPVVHVRIVRMPVHEIGMGVLMRVRLPTIPVEGVLMLMVSVVAMRVSVCQGLVHVLVFMNLGKV